MSVAGEKKGGGPPRVPVVLAGMLLACAARRGGVVVGWRHVRLKKYPEPLLRSATLCHSLPLFALLLPHRAAGQHENFSLPRGLSLPNGFTRLRASAEKGAEKV
eukprot:COSAG04_NODE_2773_length_3601_cov_5.815016_2_plen_104_part_00